LTFGRNRRVLGVEKPGRCHTPVIKNKAVTKTFGEVQSQVPLAGYAGFFSPRPKRVGLSCHENFSGIFRRLTFARNYLPVGSL
jgi:hypothetical protein